MALHIWPSHVRLDPALWIMSMQGHRGDMACFTDWQSAQDLTRISGSQLFESRPHQSGLGAVLAACAAAVSFGSRPTFPTAGILPK